MLTVENFNHENIQEEMKGWSHVEKVRLAIYCAEMLMGSFEKKHPNEDRPRLAIEAAKIWCESPTDENKEKCRATADDVFAVVYSAAAAAVYAAAAAVYAAAAVDAVVAAVAAFSVAGLKQDIIDYINDKNHPVEQSIYTQEMKDAGELPSVGMIAETK